MQRKLKLLLALLACLPLVVTGSFFAQAQAQDGETNAGPGANTVGTCSGTVQENVIVRTKDTPTTQGETGTFALLADSTVSRFVPANDFDTVVVTFSAESHLTGASGANDGIEMVARLNGVDMAPLGPITFKGDNTSSSNSATFCKRVSGGPNGTTFSVQIFTRVLDAAPLGTVTATLDDWANHVEWSQ